MTNVYIVKSSNCENYEDYHEFVDSVWLGRDNAIAHIENDLGMTQVDWRDSSKRWSRDRWLKKIPEMPKREDFNSEKDWLDMHDENGNLMPYWVYFQDAWIEEYPLNV